MDSLHDFARETESEISADAAIDAETERGIEAPVVIGSDERRMQVRAYNYWVSLLKGRTYPSVEDMEIGNTGDFGPFSVLLDFTHSGEEPTIAWLGSALRTECGLAETVTHVSAVPPRSLLSRLTDHHLQIIANRAPIGFEAEFQNVRGNDTLYRGILLPFSSDNDTIDFIYGVINWKEVASDTTLNALERQMRDSAAQLPARPMVPVWADGPSRQGAVRISPLAADSIDENEGRDREDLDVPIIEEDDTLGEWLAAARANADVALTADTRSRGALYRALSGAYDFALVAERRAQEYAELLAESRIKQQARAPMTPVAKLVFGANYDKTRLTEFAAAMSFAHRRQLPAGGMKLFLETFPGGLKAIVAAERRNRRPADREIKPDHVRQRARALPEQAYLTLSGNDEFVIMVARRVDADRVAVIGVVGDDRPLLDRALKHVVD
ncbi:MAG: hypothetical protein ACOYLK_13470 [Sphingomonas sp.]